MEMEYKKADEVVAQPVSPIGQYFSSSVLSISILAVLESEVPVDDLPAISLLKDIFLSINPRFSSIMTLNDVITGTIFLGTRLYMQAVNQESTNLHSTAVVLLNTRMLKSISSVKEMVKPDSKAPWGNHFVFLHVSVPRLTNAEIQNPLKFIRKAQEIIQSKRSSFGAYLTAKLLETVKKFRGHKTTAKFIHGSLNNSSIAITNMMGPVEKTTLANHAIKGLYFMVVGSPQSLVVTIVSYMGNLRVSLGAEEGFIDSPKLKSCIENAFEMMLNAASATPSNANFLNGHNTSSGP